MVKTTHEGPVTTTTASTSMPSSSATHEITTKKLSIINTLRYTFMMDLNYRKFLTNLLCRKLNCLLLICNYLLIVIATINTH